MNFRIFTDTSLLTSANLKNLTPPLSFHWKNLSVSAILHDGGQPDSPLSVTVNPAMAEVFMLPMIWSYYLWNGRANMDQALHLSGLAAEYDKKVIVWHKGDLVPVIPFKNAIVFLPGIVKSAIRTNQRSSPVFIDDPEPVFGKDKIKYREKREKPVVGFCGYASVNAIKMLWSAVKGAQLNILSRFGGYDFEAVPIIPATVMRSRALEFLHRHPGIETSFVIRNEYTGPKAFDGADERARAYFANIYETDYTLCLRGYGNWSYRFYETLACGRIPIFIDTDCVLPGSSMIDWKKYCVWVDQSEIGQIGEKVADFHASISNSDFIEMQMACRQLWLEHLTLEGFMSHLHEYL